MRLPHAFATTVTVALLASTAQGQTLRDAQRLNVGGFNPNGNNTLNIATLDSNAGLFVAVWAEQNGTNEFQQDVFTARSTDDGATWSTPQRVDLGTADNTTDVNFPKVKIADNGQNVVAVWEDQRDGIANMSSFYDVYANYSTDGGVTWAPSAFPLNINTAGSNVQSNVQRVWLDVDGNTFHCTWEENINGAEGVFYSRSTDGGVTWSSPAEINLNNGVNDVDDPKVAAENDVVLITWAETAGNGGDDLWLARSTDGGATFATPITVDTDATGDVDSPQVFMRGNTAVLACNEPDPGTPAGDGVTCAVSLDAGATWSADETLSVQMQSIAGADADVPVIAILGEGEIFVSYDEDSQDIAVGGPGTDDGNRVYVAYTTDGGSTWTKDVELASGLIANRPAIMAGDEALTFWFEFNPNGSNLPAFQVSFDKGATWSAPIDVVSAGPDVDEGMQLNEGRYFAASRETEDVVVVILDRPTGNNEVYTCGLDFDLGIGIPYCQANVNSTGVAAEIEAFGSLSVANDDLTLTAKGVPANQFGIFVTSLQTAFVPNPGGTSEGNLCLGGSIGRFFRPNQIKNSGAAGEYSLTISLDEFPQGNFLVSVQPGETWYFQSWYRDLTSTGQPTSNFTNGVELSFQ